MTYESRDVAHERPRSWLAEGSPLFAPVPENGPSRLPSAQPHTAGPTLLG